MSYINDYALQQMAQIRLKEDRQMAASARMCKRIRESIRSQRKNEKPSGAMMSISALIQIILGWPIKIR